MDRHQLAGIGGVLDVRQDSFLVRLEKEAVNLQEEVWLYYSQYPAWYENYPRERRIQKGDRLVFTAVFNEKARCWHVKEYSFLGQRLLATVPPMKLVPTELPMSTDNYPPENSEISGNFLGAKSPEGEEISQQVSIRLVALELACQVAPIIYHTGGATAPKILAMAKDFLTFLEG